MLTGLEDDVAVCVENEASGVEQHYSRPWNVVRVAESNADVRVISVRDEDEWIVGAQRLAVCGCGRGESHAGVAEDRLDDVPFAVIKRPDLEAAVPTNLIEKPKSAQISASSMTASTTTVTSFVGGAAIGRRNECERRNDHNERRVPLRHQVSSFRFVFGSTDGGRNQVDPLPVSATETKKQRPRTCPRANPQRTTPTPLGSSDGSTVVH